MEHNENKTELSVVPNRGGRTVNLTFQKMAERGRKVRKALMAGKGRREICESEGLSRGQYRATLAWITRNWKTNGEAFAEYQVAQEARIAALEADLDRVITDPVIGNLDKLYASVVARRTAARIADNVMEIALRLGILDREAVKVEVNSVEVCFGDERILPWFAVTGADDTLASPD